MSRSGPEGCVSCPVCGSERWIKRYKIDRWDIKECAVCGFARIDPMPQRETRPDYYSREKVDERNVRQKSFLQKLSRLLKRFFANMSGRSKSGIFYKRLCRNLSAGSRILDIGCGDGTFLEMAKKRFICSGIEVSEYLASLAEKKNGMNIFTGNFMDMDLPAGKYDGITLISLLEHLDEPAQAVKKCFDMLNKGGVLLMKTVNYNCLNRKIKKARWAGFRPPDHMVYFNPSNLRSLLKDSGFGKVNISAWPFNDNMYCEALK